MLNDCTIVLDSIVTQRGVGRQSESMKHTFPNVDMTLDTLFFPSSIMHVWRQLLSTQLLEGVHKQGIDRHGQVIKF
jgi:hypothetical protein